MNTGTGWISYTNGPGEKDHLPPEVRAEVDRRTAAVAPARDQPARWS
jgi:hypothetical protein